MPGPVLTWLAVRPDGIYIDGTAGAGGHSELIARQLSTGRLIALDRDPHAVELARRRLAPFPQAQVLHRNYGELAAVAAELGLDRVDGILIDAGVSSMQLDTGDRGFSFQSRGPLDMRMDTEQPLDAGAYLDQTTPEALARVLRNYGDIGPARRIADAILRWRGQGKLNTTLDLTAAIGDGLGVARAVPEETRCVFQALRIAVNDEYRWLEAGLRGAIDVLAPGGRLVAIAFHSGEDRIVKNVFRDASKVQRDFAPDGRVRAVHPPLLRVLTPKPITPDAEETRLNPRAHSAKLRAAERLDDSREVEEEQ